MDIAWCKMSLFRCARLVVEFAVPDEHVRLCEFAIQIQFDPRGGHNDTQVEPLSDGDVVEVDIFKNVFELQKNKVEVMLNDINEAGRSDAHAKEIEENDFQQLRLHFSKLEEILNSWLS